MSAAQIAVAIALAFATVALAACGEKKEGTDTGAAQQFDLALDFYVNPDHAGIYEGIERGYFERAGLDVEPRVPSDPSAPIKEVAAGRADLAISYEPEVFLAREQGLDVVAVAALVDEPLTSLISLPAGGIAEPSDLRGKTVATAGIPYQADYLQTIEAEAGLGPSDVSQIDVGLNLLPALLGGKADAILGGFVNVEGVDLQQRGENPLVVPVDQLGVPTYDELVLVADRDRIRDDPEEIRLFIEGLAKGTNDAAENPADATETILAAGEGLDPKLTRAEIDATLPLLQPAKGERFGEMDTEEWDAFGGWMASNQLIGELPPLDEVLTNELLPSAPKD